MGLGSREASREFLLRSCGILVHGGSVLMQEGPDGRGGRAYALPGGHVEFGETLSECLSREIFEETGLNVEADKLVYVHENFYSLNDVVTHEVGFYFLVDLASDFPTSDDQGYVPSREAHIRMRLIPLERFREFAIQPAFLRDRLPEDVKESFRQPARHLVSKEA